MPDWRKFAEIQGDVVFFEYVSEKVAVMAPFVYVWDLDKTYLDTNITSLRALFRTIREKAFQKKNVPGSATLVRALIQNKKNETPSFPLYFITASPPQMELKIKAKMEIDGILPFGAFFKDNLRNLKPNRFRRLTQQVGFKLQALLQLRQKLKADVQQILWGDDSETDALIYSLYSDICAERIEEEELAKTLESLNVSSYQIKSLFDLKKNIPKQDPVSKIYINLASDTDPDYYMKFGRRMLPTFNTFQVAMDLFQDGRITSKTLMGIAHVLISGYSFSREEILWSLEDFIQRFVLKKETVDEIVKILRENQILPYQFKFTQKTQKALEFSGELADWIPSKIDYLNDYR